MLSVMKCVGRSEKTKQKQTTNLHYLAKICNARNADKEVDLVVCRVACSPLPQLFGEKYTVFVLQRAHVATLFAQLQMMFAHEDDCVRRLPHLHKCLTGHLEGIVLIEVNWKCKWMMKTVLMPEKRTTFPC